MSTSRRDALAGIGHSPEGHAGLWLDKFLSVPKEGAVSRPAPGGEEPETRLVREVAAMVAPEEYQGAYEHWQQGLRSLGPRTAEDSLLLQAFEVSGRMVVGLGDESVLETHIALQHTYGVPFIPGSALKGLGSGYAHRVLGPQDGRWLIGGAAHTTLFGSTEAAGYIQLFAAWYVPGSAPDNRPLHQDVIVVHHPDYYQGGDPPAEWDDPTIIPLLSATGRYMVALRGPRVWAERALSILTLALGRDGVGARTSSGYGRMRRAGKVERVALGSERGQP